MKSGASESRLNQLLHTAREYLTHWAIAGTIITLTGFAPEHWVADLLSHFAIPENVRHGWLQGFDIRIGLVAVGVAIIAWDVLHRSRIAKQGLTLLGQQDKLAPVPTPDPSSNAEKGLQTPEATTLALPDKPSIAVLPFSNISGDPEQEYFTDGLTEDIVTELSRFHSLFVIAHNSSFTYKGKSVDVRTVATELGVRYVLEGSIRKAANRIRLTGQLIDATTGNHIWAEKYDRVLEDIFAVQEEVTQSIVAAIAPQIDAAEQDKARRRRPESLTAYDLALRASANGEEANRKSDFELWEQALGEAREALALDPRSVLALNTIALMQGRHLFKFMGAGPDAQARWKEGMVAATKAIELDPSGSQGYARMSTFLSLGGRTSEALATAQRAHELNPNDVDALLSLAYVELMEGQPEQTLEHTQHAVRISPRDPLHYMTNAMRAAACFFLRNHAKGIEYALLSVSAAPNWPTSHLNHVLVAVGVGDIASATAALETARRLAPDYVQRRLDGESAYRRPEDIKRVTTAFRIAAGLEDPSAAAALR